MTQHKYQQFKQFVSDLDNCFEEGLTVEEIQNRLNWAWHYLAQFAASMGGRYRDRVYCSCIECDSARERWNLPLATEERVH